MRNSFLLGGVIGVAGSGVLEYFSVGTSTSVSVPVFGFSANGVATSFANLTYIASGKFKKQGNFNLIQSGLVTIGRLLGKIADVIENARNGKKTNFEKGGKIAGKYTSERWSYG